MDHTTRLATTVAIVSLAAAPLGAQETFVTHRLADGVHAVVWDTESSAAATSNVLFIVNERDVIVVDSNILPSHARRVIAEIRKVTPNPVRYVVNTHWHGDHHFGNQAYREAFPDVEFIQHPLTKRDVIEKEIPSVKPNIDSAYPDVIRRVKRALETGKTSQGVTVTPEMRQQFTNALPVYERFVAEITIEGMITGTILVADSLVLERGERRIVIKHLGLGNTEGDLVVYLPRERILATGDLVVYPSPFGFFSFPDEWRQTLRALQALDATTVMPGHGVLQRDWRYVDALITTLDTLVVRATPHVARGASADDVITALDVEAMHAPFAVPRERFEGLFLRPAVEAMISRRGTAHP